jgi:hypothetical protein
LQKRAQDSKIETVRKEFHNVSANFAMKEEKHGKEIWVIFDFCIVEQPGDNRL